MSYQVLSIKPLDKQGNNRATVEILTPEGKQITARIVKQEGMRAYLVPPDDLTLTHKQKRHLQREAVTRWANQISNTLAGLLESEKVYKGSRMNRLHVQLSEYCPVCKRNTPSDHTPTHEGIRNSCTFCGTKRKGKPFISKEQFENIQERRQLLASNACKGIRGAHETQTL